MVRFASLLQKSRTENTKLLDCNEAVVMSNNISAGRPYGNFFKWPRLAIVFPML